MLWALYVSTLWWNKMLLCVEPYISFQSQSELLVYLLFPLMYAICISHSSDGEDYSLKKRGTVQLDR